VIEMQTASRPIIPFPELMLMSSWQYVHADPSIHLFDEAVNRWALWLPLNAVVLELGCCETDFSKWLKFARPDVRLVGVDVNPCDAQRYDKVYHQPAESLDFPTGSFDAVIALGSLEHFGLGFYGDPINGTADCEVVALAERFLKSGGWLYYDVPWTPTQGYITDNRHFRVYDDEQLAERVTAGLIETHRAYAHGNTDVWQDERPSVPTIPFWYVIRRLEKR
jgi:hypothetical protein